MRRSDKVKKYLLIFFLGVVSLGMVITLMPLSPSDAQRGDTSYLVQIGGRKITAQDLDDAIRNRLRNTQYGYSPAMAAAMSKFVLDDMIQHEAILVQARKLGIVASPVEIQRAAQAIPLLAQTGALESEEKFEQTTGMTMKQFESQLSDQIIFQKMQDIVSDGVQVSTGEVKEEFDRRNTKAKIQFVVFDPSQYIKAVQVTPDALDAYFKKNASRYSLPAKRRVHYVLIDADYFRDKVKVTDQEVKQYYDLNLSDYRIQDRAHVERILFKTMGKTPAEVAAIEKTANSVLEQIKSGKDFGDMARQHSDDASAQKGGDIGWIGHDQTEPEFEKAAFSLKSGEVSGVIKTSIGYDIIKVLERQTAHVQPLEEVQNDIRTKLEKQKLSDAQQSAADDLGHKFQQNSKNFGEIARQAGLEVKESPLFKYKEPVPDFGTSEAFANLAFQLRVNEVGDPITVPKGLAIIQLAEIVPEHAAKLDEVRPQVEEDYRNDQSKVLAANAAKQFAEKCKTGDFKAAARALKLTAKESKDFTAQGSVEGLGSASSIPTAFTLAEGKTSEVIPVGGNSVVFNVISHTQPNESDFAGQRDQITEELVDRKRSLAFEIYKDNLKQQLMQSGEIKVNDAAIKQFQSANSHQS